MPRKAGTRKLTETDVASIVTLVEGWSGKRITWPALCERVAASVGQSWTRQALEKHPSIKEAYQRVRDGNRKPGRKRSTDPTDVILMRRVEHLTEEVEKLRNQLSAYEERFVRYEYNAAARGLTPQQLGAPLPAIDRGRSDR